MRSVRSKLVALVAAAVGCAIVFMAAISAWSSLSARYEAKRQELQGTAAAIAVAVAHPLAEGLGNDLARTLSSVGRIPGITYARITDRDGRTVQQFGFGILVAHEHHGLKPNEALGPLSAVYLGTYPVTAPIISGGVEIGTLLLIADLSSLRGLILEQVTAAVAAGCLAFVLAFAATGRLMRGIVSPIARLTEAMDGIRRTRDYSGSVARASNDEVGRMVDAFNGMLAEVRVRDQTIAGHRDRLEIEVAERTADLVEAKAAAEAASAAKSDFLATMSHEIRTPMNGMLVMAELMASAGLTPRTQRYADVLLSSGKTLLAIINDILDFSKIEAGKLELESIPTSPRVLVDDVVRLFFERAGAKGIDLTAHVAGDVPESIAADPVRLTQILSNLVNNALKFTDAGGVSIHVGVTSTASPRQPAAGRQLVIDVVDTGIGIAGDKMATIFEAFSQADQSTTRRFGGTGIGLTICRRLVDAMGGRITVSSRLGSGSTFSVVVPVHVLQAATALPSWRGDGPRAVIVALDDTPTRAALCAYLRDRGLLPYCVSTTTTPAGDVVPSARALIVDDARASAWAAPSAGRPPLVFVVSGIGASRQAGRLPVDGAIELPLRSIEVRDCLDHIVTGHGGASAPAKARLDAAATTPALAGIRVLAADDNAVNREVLMEALGRLGIAVDCVPDGAAAVAAVEHGDYDVVFMDCSMPVMDGFAATRAIRARESERGTPAVPVVALTAHVVGTEADAWRDAGMSDYLTKPYTLRALVDCLGRAVASRAPRAPETASDRDSTDAPHAAGSVAAPAGDAAVDDDWIDANVLDGIREMTGPDNNLLDRVISLYATHAPAALEALRSTSARPTSGDAVADAAHALKSLSRNVGAVRIARLCEAIEADAREGRTSDLEERCLAITSALPPTLAALRQSGSPRAAADRTAGAAA